MIMTTVLVWFILQDEDHSYQTRKVRTRMKLGCPAKIYIREIVSFPDFQVITYKEESVEHTLYMHCFTDAFYRASYASVVYAVIMCLSVCPSVTSRSATMVAKPRITQTMPYDSP